MLDSMDHAITQKMENVQRVLSGVTSAMIVTGISLLVCSLIWYIPLPDGVDMTNVLAIAVVVLVGCLSIEFALSVACIVCFIGLSIQECWITSRSARS